MITIKDARTLLGDSAIQLTDEEIEKLRNQLYQLISQIIDNNLDKIKQ